MTTTRNYGLQMNIILASSRELTRDERLRLKREMAMFLTRQWRIDLALLRATDGQVQITGRAQVQVPEPR